ncbi:MAG: hypothetical protein GSR79_04070 [Desulfurococcales archaeon]|nr:hypothetical protein [Desulfurococcales archaeon]
MHISKLGAILFIGLALLGGVFAYAALNMELGKISYHIVITPTTVTATEFSIDLGYIYPPSGQNDYTEQFTMNVGGDNPAHLMFNLTNTDTLENDFSDFHLTITLSRTDPDGAGTEPITVDLYSPSDATHPSCVEIDLGRGDYSGDVSVSYTINNSLSSDVIRTDMPLVQLVQDGTCSP